MCTPEEGNLRCQKLKETKKEWPATSVQRSGCELLLHPHPRPFLCFLRHFLCGTIFPAREVRSWHIVTHQKPKKHDGTNKDTQTRRVQKPPGTSPPRSSLSSARHLRHRLLGLFCFLDFLSPGLRDDGLDVARDAPIGHARLRRILFINKRYAWGGAGGGWGAPCVSRRMTTGKRGVGGGRRQ